MQGRCTTKFQQSIKTHERGKMKISHLKVAQKPSISISELMSGSATVTASANHALHKWGPNFEPLVAQ
jgi:hypothetical protein